MEDILKKIWCNNLITERVISIRSISNDLHCASLSSRDSNKDDLSDLMKECIDNIRTLLNSYDESRVDKMAPLQLVALRNMIKEALMKLSGCKDIHLLSNNCLKTYKNLDNEIIVRRNNYFDVSAGLPLATYLYYLPMILDLNYHVINETYEVDEDGLDKYVDILVERSGKFSHAGFLAQFPEEGKIPKFVFSKIHKRNDFPELHAASKTKFVNDSAESFIVTLIKALCFKSISKQEVIEKIKSRLKEEQQYFDKVFSLNKAEVSNPEALFVQPCNFQISQSKLNDRRKTFKQFSTIRYPVTLTNPRKNKPETLYQHMLDIVNPGKSVDESVKLSNVELTSNMRVIGTTGSGIFNCSFILSEFAIFNDKLAVYILDSQSCMEPLIYAKAVMSGRSSDVVTIDIFDGENVDIRKYVEQEKIIIIRLQSQVKEKSKNYHCHLKAIFEQIDSHSIELDYSCVTVMDFMNIDESSYDCKEIASHIQSINKKNGCVIWSTYSMFDTNYNDSFEALFKTTILMKSYEAPDNLMIEPVHLHTISSLYPGQAFIYFNGLSISDKPYMMRYNDDLINGMEIIHNYQQ
ncbi:hypothetical protein ABWJ26_002523 [Vibrio fluvialis]